MEKKNEMNIDNTKENEHQRLQSPSNKSTGSFFKFNFFQRSKTEENPGFINRQMPAYFYDGKS